MYVNRRKRKGVVDSTANSRHKFLRNEANQNTMLNNQSKNAEEGTTTKGDDPKKGTKLSSSTFEQYLKKDLLFVQYFNAFLASPAFTRKLEYDEDTQLISDISDGSSISDFGMKCPTVESHSKLRKPSRSEDSNAIIAWCKINRLPFFLKSKYYSDYKLCRNLLSNSNDGRQLSAVTAFSPLLSTSAYSADRRKENPERLFSRSSLKSWPEIANDFERMPSRATSLPNFKLFGEEEHCVDKAFAARPATSGHCQRALIQDFDGDIEKELEDLCIDEAEKRTTVFAFEDDDSDFDEQTEGDVMSLSIKRRTTFEDLKTASVGSMQGMESFKSFLSKTNGHSLLRFWLDAEYYKNQIRGWQECPTEKKELGARLFRVMQDRYKYHLTADAKEQIKLALESEGYSESLFIRAQVDILKRLKSYWLPRFLVHVERTLAGFDINDNGPCRLTSAMSFFPSLSVVKTLPTLGHILAEEAREHSFHSLYQFRESTRIKSGYIKKVTFKLPEESMHKDAFLQAIRAEKETGCPFTASLTRLQASELLHLLRFWLDVEDFIKQNDKAEDRLYRLCNAWNIFNKYISNTEMMIVKDPKEVERVRDQLSQIRDITRETALALFDNLQLRAAEVLRRVWEDCQEEEKNDLSRASREQSTLSQHSSRINTLERKVEFSPSRWIKRYPGSSESERKVRLQTALSMADECNFSRQSSREVQQSEKSKKKKRKNRKGVKFKPDESDSETKETAVQEEQPQFSNLMESKEVVVAFKQFIQDEEGRDILNKLLLYLDIEALNDIHATKRLQRQQQSAIIYRTYFDSSSRRAVILPDETVDKVEDEVPSTPLLLEAKDAILPDLEACFQKFYKKAQHVAIKSREATTDTIRTRTASNKPDTMESFRSYHSHVNTPKPGKKKRKGTGRIQPTKEDRATFLEAVQACSGKLTAEMDSFRRYLAVKDDPGTFQRLENDLLFYMEVQKFKDLYPFLDETALNRKVEVIIDVYLDSATPPWLQIDLSSELAARVMQRAQQYYSATKRVPREQKDPFIFDDAQSYLLKEIVPYWAGYCKLRRANEKLPEFPLTKKEREKRKRYTQFRKAASTNEKVPNRPKTPGAGESKHELTYSIGKGFKWKDAAVDLESLSSQSSDSRMSGSRKSSAFSVTSR
eukprot:gene17584-19337_t